MRRYEIIYESLCDQVENGELALEDAQIINDLAYNKYIKENSILDKIKNKRRFKKMNDIVSKTILGTIDNVKVSLHYDYRDDDLSEEDIENIKEKYKNVESAFVSKYKKYLKNCLTEVKSSYSVLNDNLKPEYIYYKVKGDKSYFEIYLFTKVINKDTNNKENILIDCELTFNKNKLSEDSIQLFSHH